MKDLKRTAYQRMLTWKKRPDHKTLEVSGARQVGKTYLVNKFADEQYTQKIYVNLLELSGELFQEIYQDMRKEMKEGKRFQNPLRPIVRRFPLSIEFIHRLADIHRWFLSIYQVHL